MKSLVIGGSSIDTLIHVPEINSIVDDMSLWATSVSENVGGTGAGKALALDTLGSEVTLITELGKDENGRKIESFFATTKIKLLPVDTDCSTSHTNIMHSQGKRITVTTTYPTIIPKPHSKVVELIKECDVIFLNINEFCRQYIPYLKEVNKPILVDIHDYQEGNIYHQDFINIATILVSSGINLPNHQAFLLNQIEKGKEIVIITSGSNGLIAMDHNRNTEILPGYNDFEYVDSNGAGDSFCAGFMIKFYETRDMFEALKFGTICGGIACTSYDLFNRNYNRNMVENITKGAHF